MKKTLIPSQAPSRYMRYVLLGTLMLCLSMCKKDLPPDNSSIIDNNSVVTDNNPKVTGDVYTIVDQPPTPQGGQAGLASYLMKNVRYPASAQRAQIQGKVVVGFVVTSTGRIADVQIEQSVGGGCDEEAVRVIKGMPTWIPGQLNGKAVNVKTSLPISFILQ